MVLDRSQRGIVSSTQGARSRPRWWLLAVMLGAVGIAMGIAGYWSLRSPVSPVSTEATDDADGEEPPAVVHDYLGMKACAACHAKRVAEFSTTSHFRASRLPNAGEMPPGFAPGQGVHATRVPGVRFEMAL